MADFVESAKNFVSAAVSRTSWEAQKQMRARGKQGELDKLLEQRRELLDQLGQVALTLYQQNALQDPQLSRICSGVLELDADLRKHEEQLQEIKDEAYPASQFAPAPTTDYTAQSAPPTASSRAGRGAGSNAGANPGPGQTPRTQGQTQLCPTCGNPVRPNALYCRSCGAKLR